jgi:DNA-binding response OmpR family regulator
LEDYGVEVLMAHTVAQAEDLIAETSPDMFIVDVMMPDVDGLRFVRRLRKESSYEKTPILVASAKTMNGDREAAFDAGASEFLTKPFTSKQLRDMLRIYLPLPTTSELRGPWTQNLSNP